MEYEIIPSLLPVEDRLQEAVDRIKDHVKSVHIDVMDSLFVYKKAFGVDAVVNLQTGLKKIVHLMTVEPEKKVPEYALADVDMITFHVEASDDPASVIKDIKDLEVKAGIALKPETPVDDIALFLDDADAVLVMTVEPGRGGQEFMPGMLEKIKDIRALKPEIDIMVDGGINKSTIGGAKKAGANKFIAGTAIFKEKDPVKAILDLRMEIE